MELPIPQDWNGDDWICVNVQWPDSPLWVAILQGFLSAATRGRLWSAESGSILAVQAIGRDIWARNVPLVDCDAEGNGGHTGTPDDINEILASLGLGESEECGMNCCLKWIDGVLSIWDCGAWVPVPGDALTPEDTLGSYPPDLPGIVDPETLTYSACGKASALTDVIFRIANAVWEQLDNLIVWQRISGIEDDVGLDLNNKHLIIAMGIGSEMAGAATWGIPLADDNWIPSLMFSDGNRSKLRNMAKTLMADDSGGITEENFEALKQRFSESFLPDVLMTGYWASVFSALGPNKARQVSAEGSLDLAAECEDYELPTQVRIGEEYATDGGWYIGARVSGEVTDTNESIQAVRGIFTTTQDLFGIVMRITRPNADVTIKPMDYDIAVGGLGDTGTPTKVLWGDTSGKFHLDVNEWYIFQDDAEVAFEIATQLGFSSSKQSTAGVWSADPAVPGADYLLSAAEVYGWEIDRLTGPSGDFGPLTVNEVYPIYNINSPSHA